MLPHASELRNVYRDPSAVTRLYRYCSANNALSDKRLINATSSTGHLSSRISLTSPKYRDLQVKIERYIKNRQIIPGTEVDTDDIQNLYPSLSETLQKHTIEDVVNKLFKHDDYKTIFSTENGKAKNSLKLAESETLKSVINIQEDYKNIYTRGNIKTHLNVEEINPIDKKKADAKELYSLDGQKNGSEEITPLGKKKVKIWNEKVTESGFESENIPVNTEIPHNVDKPRQLSFSKDIKIFDKENGDTHLYHAITEELPEIDEKNSRVSSKEKLGTCNIREAMKREQEAILDLPHKLTESKVENKCEWRRQCGCLKTSEKLKELLKRFPSPPPPPPSTPSPFYDKFEPTSCISAYCTDSSFGCAMMPKTFKMPDVMKEKQSDMSYKQALAKNLWRATYYLVSLLQLSVTTTALALYYIIYFYMQLIYYVLLSAMFFHNADGPMKITIGVVTITSLIVGFNLLLRMERFVGMSLNE